MKRAEIPPEGAEPQEGENAPEATARQGQGAADAVPSDGAGSHPRLRRDLRFVHEGAPPSRTSRRLPGRLRLIDPRSGRQYDFTSQEHVLCRGADGETPVEDIRARLKRLTDTPLTDAQVAKFFRRLGVLGLLETETPAAPAGNGRRMGPRARAGMAPKGQTGQPRRFGAQASGEGPAEALADTVPDGGEDAAATQGGVTSPRRFGGTRPAAPDATASAPAEQKPRRFGVGAAAPVAPVEAPDAHDTSAKSPPRFGGATPAGSSGTSATGTEEPARDAAPRRFGAKADADTQTPQTTEPQQPRRFAAAPAASEATGSGARRFAAAPVTSVPESGEDTSAANTGPRRRFGQVRPVETDPPADEDNAGTAAPDIPPLSPVQGKPRAVAERPAGSGQVVHVGHVRGKRNADAASPASGAPDPSDAPSDNPFDDAEEMTALFHETEADGDDAPTPSGTPGGGIRRPGGGMGGGMGGMMGGGMGAGMMGGMGGGMGGMGGGMGGMGGMMGGMMGGRGMQQPAPEPKKGPAQLPLFNPMWLFRTLYVLGWPLKFVIWALLPVVVVAGLSMINNMPALVEDFTAMLANFSFVTKLLIGVLMVNFGSRLAQGVAIIAHGGKVRTLGINLVLGLLPRFYIDTAGIDTLDRRGQLWAHGAPLLARLAFFSAGILTWAVTRDQGGSLPILALTVAQFGLLMFTMTAWPFLPADGMRWMSVMFNEPKLMPKAVMAFKHSVLKGRLPPMMDRSEILPLTMFAIGTMLTTGLLLGITAALLLVLLQGTLGGLGVMIFLGMMTIVTLWFLALYKTTKASMPKMPEGMGGMGGMGGAMPAGQPQAPGRTKDAPRRPAGRGRPAAMAAANPAAVAQAPDAEEEVALPNRAKVVWAIILIAAVIVSFLPYHYETGGEVEILPLARGQAVARTDGEIVEVFVRQGASVTEGQELARLSDWDQASDISIAEARLDGARAELQRLEVGAQQEEVDLARAQLSRAEANLNFKLSEVERARELLSSATVSQATVDRAETDYAAAVADLEYARASLALVESGATREELEIARADVARLERELAFARDELARTRIVAPLEGKVVTADLHLKRGDFLRTGDLLLEIEQSETVTATISVPEADIGLVQPDQVVRLRVRGDAATEVQGTVQSVAPAAEDAGYGRIVRVTAEFPNEEGLLRSAMTGHAKVEGVDMRVWEAYMRSILRFIQIDMWSWIP